MNKISIGDIDIDCGDRDKILKHIKHIPAAMLRVSPPRKHTTGIYVGPVPYDPLSGAASIDYTDAESRSYYKIDLLNVHLYNSVTSEEHLEHLLREPDWSMLKQKSVVQRLMHINNHWENLQRMAEPIDSIPKLAMFIALIRPGKKHLIGKSWDTIEQNIWTPDGEGYTFKRSHSHAYAHLIVVNMNLISDGLDPAYQGD